MSIHGSSPSFKKGYKFPIYPTAAQEELLNKTAGCCRYVYNKALAESKKAYVDYLVRVKTQIFNKPDVPDVTGYAHANKLSNYRADKDSLWLKEISSVALQQSLINLGAAYTSFFKKRSGFPKFKSRHDKQSFRLTNSGFSMKDGIFTVAKLDTPIKVVLSRELPSTPSSVVISKDTTGKWYASFICEYKPAKTTGTKISGIDLGIKDFLVTSDGTKLPNFRYLKSYQQQLKRAQQSLSRCKKGSKNRTKARLKVATIHARISNCRSDFLHKTSRNLINESQVLGIENLVVKNMVKNRKLSKAISDTSWGKFKEFLLYKAVESQHCTIVIVDTYFPSSHLCSATGEKLDRKLKLSERSWLCPHCGQVHDRDINAAINIKNEAIYTLATIKTVDARIVLGASKR